MEEVNKDFNRRRAERASIVGSYVSWKVLDANKWSVFENELEAPVINVSKGGICFSAKEGLPPNALLGLNIRFNEASQPIKMFGRVVWSKDKNYDSRNPEIGVMFSWWMREKDKKELDRFVDEHIAEGFIYK